jgi:predicted dehydrogenase
VKKFSLRIKNMSTHPPIRLALVGAGLFARDAHLPSIKALDKTFDITAVYSYRKSSAEGLLEKLPPDIDFYDDLAALLTRDDIEAVDILLPIDIMPDAVEQALRAGKHVISEKPVAPDVAIGRRLLAACANCPDQVWMVAENWRYDPVWSQAATMIQNGDIGKPVMVHFAQHTDMTPANKYYHTDWRRSGTWPGGFLLDGGVHPISALRMLLGEVIGVTAFAKQQREDLPPADTLVATLEFTSGAIGSYSVTYVAGTPWPSVLQIGGSTGALRIQNNEIELAVANETRQIRLAPSPTVQNELAAFALSIREGVPHLNTPQEALRDVAVIEAMLLSAQTGQRVHPEVI